jgi:hypothetical protein
MSAATNRSHWDVCTVPGVGDEDGRILWRASVYATHGRTTSKENLFAEGEDSILVTVWDRGGAGIRRSSSSWSRTGPDLGH